MALLMAIKHGFIYTAIITMIAFEWFITRMIALMILQVMFVLCYKLAQFTC